jgi:hypothetical protein
LCGTLSSEAVIFHLSSCFILCFALEVEEEEEKKEDEVGFFFSSLSLSFSFTVEVNLKRLNYF